MPRKRSQPGSDYDSDDGFVVKKSKTEAGASSAKSSKSKSKGESEALPGGGSRTPEGDEYWELSTTRRVTLSKFKNQIMVSIREYYEKDGQTLPGKKGITMPMAQFSALIELLPHIEAVLKSKNETIPRPDYSAVPSTNEAAHDDDDNDDGDGDAAMQEDEQVAVKKEVTDVRGVNISREVEVAGEEEEDDEDVRRTLSKSRQKKKKNFEETSEEDE